MWDLETIRRMNDEAVERERARTDKAIALRTKYELNGQELDVTPANPPVSNEGDARTSAKVAGEHTNVKITATDDAVTVVVSGENQKAETFVYDSGFPGLTGADLRDVLTACGIRVKYEYTEKAYTSEDVHDAC